jgi:hypothetical protein
VIPDLARDAISAAFTQSNLDVALTDWQKVDVLTWVKVDSGLTGQLQLASTGLQTAVRSAGPPPLPPATSSPAPRTPLQVAG